MDHHDIHHLTLSLLGYFMGLLGHGGWREGGEGREGKGGEEGEGRKGRGGRGYDSGGIAKHRVTTCKRGWTKVGLAEDDVLINAHATVLN